MNPGEFNQRLIFQQSTGGTDADGFPIDQPIEYLRSWAKLKTLRGFAFYAAAQSNLEHNRLFTLRYRKELEDDTRPNGLIVVWKNIDHEIISIENDDGLNKTMTIRLRAVS